MKNNALLYFPTSVLFLDNDDDFLVDTIEKEIPNKNLYYTSPQKALDDITKGTVESIRGYLCKQLDFSCSCTQCDIRFCLHDLPGVFRDENKMNYVSVLVVDYDMPGMNGLEFLSHLPKKSFKSILLTGEADARVAVEAFNKQAIDAFVTKTEPQLGTVLRQTICDLQKDSFMNYSSLIEQTIKKVDLLPSAIFNQRYWETFEEVLKKEKVVEYYLIDVLGSFLLVTEEGKRKQLLVKSEDALEADFQEMTAEEAISPELKEQLETKQKMLVRRLQMQPDYYENWQTDVDDATLMPGTQFYYNLKTVG